MDLNPREQVGDELSVVFVGAPASVIHKDGHVAQIWVTVAARLENPKEDRALSL